jgi:putative transposase
VLAFWRQVNTVKKIHTIHLPEGEVTRLTLIIHKGKENTRVITRARVLLMANEGKKDPEIYTVLSLSVKTPYEIRKRCHEGGLKKALYDAPRPGQPRKLNGKQEAKVVAIACTKAPKGYDHWTMDLLTEEVHNQGMEIGRTAVWKILLRSDTKPWRKKNVVYSGHYA